MPATMRVMPRSTTAKPTVVVIWMKCGWRRTGASVRTSCAAPSDGAEQRCDQDREPERHVETDETRGGHAAQHDELALCEVHHAGDVGAQHEAERDQRIDAAGGEARQQQLQEERGQCITRPEPGLPFCSFARRDGTCVLAGVVLRRVGDRAIDCRAGPSVFPARRECPGGSRRSASTAAAVIRPTSKPNTLKKTGVRSPMPDFSVRRSSLPTRRPGWCRATRAGSSSSGHLPRWDRRWR